MNTECEFIPNTVAGERRENRRYELSLDLRYKLTRGKRVIEAGTGRTLDMSSGGVAFTVGQPLSYGVTAELSIDWPVSLDGVPLCLVVRGRIVRSRYGNAALRMSRHEFRLAGTRGAHAAGRTAHSGDVELMTRQ